jgi:hypothetical protein
MNVSDIGSFFYCNQDHVYSAVTAIATVLLVVISAIALRTWRKEKHFDLIIESLAFARECEEMVKDIRNPFSNRGELTSELTERLEKEGENRYLFFIYLSRKQRHRELYERLVKFYFRNWAKEGENGLMTKYFNMVLQILRDIDLAFATRNWAQEEDSDYRKKVYKNTDAIIMSRQDKDEIATKIANAVAELEKHYRKLL